MLTFCINLNRSRDRWDRMRTRFPHQNMVRIEAIDGRQWENGIVDADGRPQWKEEARDALIDKGLIAEKWWPTQRLIPGELGCTMSHAAVWQMMLDKEIPQAIVMEDDIKPVALLDGRLEDHFKLTGGMDVLFLSGANKTYHFGNGVSRPCVNIDLGGRLLKGYGTYAYAITRFGAEVALQSIKKSVLPLPQQWFIRAFHGYRGFHPALVPLGQQCSAYAMREALIEVSEADEISTMTPYGGKPWRSKVRKL